MYYLLGGRSTVEREPDSFYPNYSDILNHSPSPLSSMNKDVPVGLSKLVMKSLEKDPAKRPSHEELIEGLESIT